MDAGEIILFLAAVLLIWVIIQYARAVQLKAVPWWNILITLSLSLGVPNLLAIVTFTAFGRAALFIGPLSVLVAYGLITTFSIVYYTLKIKRIKSKGQSDSILDAPNL